MFGSNRAPILHRQWLPTDRNESPLDPRHLGVPSGVSKMISEPMVCSAPTMHLSCTDTGSQRTKMRFHMTHVTYEYHRVRPKRFPSLWYVRRQPCTYLAPTLVPTDRNEIPLDPRHLGVPSGASKMISEPMVCSAQTVPLSCTDTGSQRTETRLHTTHVT